jgi:two-component system response regulator GlrR
MPMPTPDPTEPGAHILVVNGEPSILGFITTALTTSGFRVTAVCRPDQAAALVCDLRPVFAAAVLDLDAPVGDVLSAVRPRLPGLPVVLTAASADAATAAAVRADPAARLLPKPFRADELVRALRGAFGPA